MYRDGYFPYFLIDKVKELVQKVVSFFGNRREGFRGDTESIG